jgi:hypothetical protein
MKLDRNKISKYNGLAETFYVGTITGIYRYGIHLIDKGGVYSLLLMPVMELVKFSLYLAKTKEANFDDSPLKKGLNLIFKGLKVVASAVGAGLAVAGISTLGFGVMILSGYASVARNLFKAVRSARDGDVAKVTSNLRKAAVSGLISGGFTLMTFFTPFAWIGGIMVFIATGHLALSMVPGVIAESVVPPLQVTEKSDPAADHVKKLYLPSARFTKQIIEESEAFLPDAQQNITRRSNHVKYI